MFAKPAYVFQTCTFRLVEHCPSYIPALEQNATKRCAVCKKRSVQKEVQNNKI